MNKAEKPQGWKKTLNEVLQEHNKAASVGGKAASFATQAARREILDKGFKELHGLGFKLLDVYHFKGRHMRALGFLWETKGLSSSTIQNRISVFRVFAEWIGKKGMIRRSECYVKEARNVERHLVARRDKTWSGQKQSLDEKLAKIAREDRYVALQLELQRSFGLRMKEAALLRPHQADRLTYLAVSWGTKGGRSRVVDITTDYQRDVLNRAKLLIRNQNGSMVPTHCFFSAWRNHYYYICQKVGISRKDGIVGHGLRHERLNEVYYEITGENSPIKRGTITITAVPPTLDAVARQEIAEVAGHSRPSIAAAYIGTLGQKPR